MKLKDFVVQGDLWSLNHLRVKPDNFEEIAEKCCVVAYRTISQNTRVVVVYYKRKFYEFIISKEFRGSLGNWEIREPVITRMDYFFKNKDDFVIVDKEKAQILIKQKVIENLKK